MTALTHQLTNSEREWLEVRAQLRKNRPALTEAAAATLPERQEVAGTHLLTRPGWIPDRPIPLKDIILNPDLDNDLANVAALIAASQDVLPSRADGSHYRSYAEALGEIAAPTVFENRPTYRLLDADLADPRPRLKFGRGEYFDGINTGEAAAHEFAAARLGMVGESRLRTTVGDPCDLSRRPVNLAISTLTIRHDRAHDRATCLIHWRDPAKVGHAGGLYQVVPVGIFQPSGRAAWNQRNDLSLWRGIVRELSEELLGEDEDYSSEQQPIDYDAWPFAARLTRALSDASVRAYCLGMGVDPLTYATDLLTAVVVDAPTFDEIFGAIQSDNAEGRVLEAVPFEKDALRSLISRHPFQAAGEALLELALSFQLPHN